MPAGGRIVATPAAATTPRDSCPASTWPGQHPPVHRPGDVNGGDGNDTITTGLGRRHGQRRRRQRPDRRQRRRRHRQRRTAETTTIAGGLGDDNIVGGAGNDNLSGDAGGDTVYGDRATTDHRRSGPRRHRARPARHPRPAASAAGPSSVNGPETLPTEPSRTSPTSSPAGVATTASPATSADDQLFGDDAARPAASVTIQVQRLRRRRDRRLRQRRDQRPDRRRPDRRRPGDDTLTGGAGNDTLCGNAGDDVLEGDEGPSWHDRRQDELRGGLGDDRLSRPRRRDYADGGPGNDLVASGAAADVALGGTGSDAVNSGADGTTSCSATPGARDQRVFTLRARRRPRPACRAPACRHIPARSGTLGVGPGRDGATGSLSTCVARVVLLKGTGDGPQGRADLNGDGTIDGSDDGRLDGFRVIDGKVDVNARRQCRPTGSTPAWSRTAL